MTKNGRSLSELVTELPGARSPADALDTVDAVADAELIVNIELVEQMEAPEIDWEAWVRRLRQTLEVAPTGGAWGYARGELQLRRSILRGEPTVASNFKAQLTSN